MNLEFRPAQSADVSAAVPLIYSSGPAAFDYVFAHRAVGSAQDFLHRAFMDGHGEFGYRNHLVAVSAGQVVGIGAAFSGETGLAFTLHAARQIFGVYGFKYISQVIINGLQVEKIVQPPTGKLHYLAHLGVAPDWRSRGIGAQLIAQLEQQGRAQGRPLAALDVATTNPRAQALYERQGYRVTKELISNLSNGTVTVASHRRMEKRLV